MGGEMVDERMHGSGWQKSPVVALVAALTTTGPPALTAPMLMPLVPLVRGIRRRRASRVARVPAQPLFQLRHFTTQLRDQRRLRGHECLKHSLSFIAGAHLYA